jgi:hypothetical protein
MDGDRLPRASAVQGNGDCIEIAVEVEKTLADGKVLVEFESI